MSRNINKEQLAEVIEQKLAAYFAATPLITSLQRGRWALTTVAIKEFISRLGRDLEFEVSASGCSNAGQEWLYDMVWYEVADGYMTRLALAGECELTSPQLPVDDDFTKLVQARADVRLWISAPKNREIADTHLANCKRYAATFPGAMPGDTYVLVSCDWTDKITIVERFVVGQEALAN
ncbi:hypothetical protein AS156_04045 [Bradyrhizobium macuxiense]|uniref:Uncharacterized protein n=1 Tax=Bradyrhizobium macuxiense TaxID=1755647 RepID=A0A120FPA3_9BRAD|nr:hypothetical protein [Bradyrhizobium macuxiense]KWV56657.1 hypothetical protein AS156_04045 [Bradyrhizobium macuxiense]